MSDAPTTLVHSSASSKCEEKTEPPNEESTEISDKTMIFDKVEDVVEVLHKELRTRQKMHEEAIKDLRSGFALKQARFTAHEEKVKNGAPPKVVFSQNFKDVAPDIQQMLEHGGAMCAFGRTGHDTAHQLALVAAMNMNFMFHPVGGDILEDKSGDDTCSGELSDSAMSISAMEITNDGDAINLLGHRRHVRAFHHKEFGVTFPDLVTVTVKNAYEVAKVIDSNANVTIGPLSTIIWMMKRGDCCYGPNRLVIVGLPPHGSPDDASPKKVALLLDEGQQTSFICGDDVKTLNPMYSRISGRLEHSWRCNREEYDRTPSCGNSQSSTLADATEVQHNIARLRKPCHMSYSEIVPESKDKSKQEPRQKSVLRHASFPKARFAALKPLTAKLETSNLPTPKILPAHLSTPRMPPSTTSTCQISTAETPVACSAISTAKVPVLSIPNVGLRKTTPLSSLCETPILDKWTARLLPTNAPPTSLAQKQTPLLASGRSTTGNSRSPKQGPRDVAQNVSGTPRPLSPTIRYNHSIAGLPPHSPFGVSSVPPTPKSYVIREAKSPSDYFFSPSSVKRM